MIRRPPRSTRTDTLFPYTTLFRSLRRAGAVQVDGLGDLRLERPVARPGPGGVWGGRRGVGEIDMDDRGAGGRSEEHTSELPSLMRISYAVFCLKKKKISLQHMQQNERQVHKRYQRYTAKTNK